MGFTYQSGEEIKTGDQVRLHGEPGEVELVADPLNTSLSDADKWYVTEFGAGVMIREPKAFGRVFFSEPENEEDLEFIARRSFPSRDSDGAVSSSTVIPMDNPRHRPAEY
jgi:hypothetical protein